MNHTPKPKPPLEKSKRLKASKKAPKAFHTEFGIIAVESISTVFEYGDYGLQFVLKNGEEKVVEFDTEDLQKAAFAVIKTEFNLIELPKGKLDE
jgi:hypothetical protein